MLLKNMNLKNLQHKKIALLGLGVENLALLNYCLKNKVQADFTVCDKRDIEALGDKFKVLNKHDNVFWQLGEEFNQKLDRYDILFRSPGWPLDCPGIRHALKNACHSGAKRSVAIESRDAIAIRKAHDSSMTVVYSPMKLFFDLCPTKNIIGVTGTKGKGTTSSLIFGILKEAKKTVYLGGNIGIAPFDFLPKLKKNDYVILELSSFQLEDLHKSPHIAVFTNFTPEHLAPADPNNPNYHHSLVEYFKAKLNITLHQKNGDYLVINSNFKFPISKQFPNTKSQIYEKSKAKVIAFDKSDWPSQLPGEHNKENIAAAEVVAQILKIAPEVVARAVRKFKGLEHRLELVAEKKGVKYYDDSFATTPESTIIALKSFDKPIILLAGGADKGADFKNLAKEVAKRVKFVILFDGKATPRLKKELLTAGFSSAKIKVVKSMSEAVALSTQKAVSDDIVLMSTACASFGMFKNYKERGNLFKTEALK